MGFLLLTEPPLQPGFPVTGPFQGQSEKNLGFFEMSAQKIFRKGEPNRVNQPKLT